VILIAHVLPDRLRVVAFDRWGTEAAGRCRGDLQPEPLGCFHVCALVDVDPEAQVRPRSAGSVEEAEEEPDQGRVAVNEGHPVAAPVRLALRTFAPVGDGARDKDLAVGQFAYLRGRT